MDFEWDGAKAASNLAKHGVAFEIVYELDWTNAPRVSTDGTIMANSDCGP